MEKGEGVEENAGGVFLETGGGRKERKKKKKKGGGRGLK